MCHTAALLGARFRSTESSLLGIEDGGPGGDFEVPPGVNMGRRRSRAVLYQLSGHYKPEKIKTKLKLNNVSTKRFNKSDRSNYWNYRTTYHFCFAFTEFTTLD